MEKRIAENIERYGLLHKQKPVIVGVSGGADSIALLAALTRLGYECIAVHCNYHLRGEESNRDMRHTQSVCAALGVDLYVRDFDVDARRQTTGESVEMACRELRYQWMHSLLDRRRAQAIAVAHHQEDNIETFLLNLIRGSSISGLTGMRWRNGYVVRPMLDITRGEIESYLAALEIDYVVDSSNRENHYARNRLRNLVLPMLEEQFPGASRGILESIRLLSQNREFYDQAIAERSDKYLRGDRIDLRQLLADEAQAPLVLYEMIKGWGFNMTQVRNMLDGAASSGLHFSAGNTTIEIDRGVASILSSAPYREGKGERAKSKGEMRGQRDEISLRRDVLSPIHIVVSVKAVETFRPGRDPHVAYFDESVLEGDPHFSLRHWQRGDRMRPYGMRGSKLLSDIFADAKLTAQQKRDVWLLTRNDEILWVVGLRQSGTFAIGPATKRYLALEAK